MNDNDLLEEIHRAREKVAADAGKDSQQMLAWCAPKKSKHTRQA